MKITVICVGGLKESYLKALEKRFIKQISTTCEIAVVEIEAEKASKNIPIVSIKNKEGEKILKHIQKGSFVIALDVSGKQLDLKGFRRLALKGITDISFVIGGSFGLSETVINQSDFLLSFSSMTFPHHVIRIILLEQLTYI